METAFAEFQGRGAIRDERLMRFFLETTFGGTRGVVPYSNEKSTRKRDTIGRIASRLGVKLLLGFDPEKEYRDKTSEVRLGDRA